MISYNAEVARESRGCAIARGRGMANRDVRRRIDAAIGRGVVSGSALAQVVTSFTDGEVSHTAARLRIARAMEKKVNMQTPCGSVIQSVYVPAIRGADLQLFWVHPVAVLLMFAVQITGFGAVLRELAFEYDRMWKAIIYEDGAETGALLRVDHNKAMCLYYYSYQEFGVIRRSHSDWWMLLGETRLSVVKRAQGKHAAVFKALATAFRTAWLEGAAKIAFNIAPRPFSIGADLSRSVFDESASCEVYGFTGSGGIMPCWCCENVTDWNHERAAHDRSGVLVHIGCSDPERFLLSSNDTMFAKVDELAAAAAATGRRPKQLESRYGLRHAPQLNYAVSNQVKKETKSRANAENRKGDTVSS